MKDEQEQELKQKANPELFQLYQPQLDLNLRSRNSVKEANRLLGHFQSFLSDRPPSKQLAEAFLAQFSSRKSTTLYRYHSIINGFMKWYGDPLNTKIRVPRTVPNYIEETDVDKLKEAIATTRTSSKNIERNLLCVDLMSEAGLRRGEVANLKVSDVDLEREQIVVRSGKGQKDRVVDLTSSLKNSLSRHLDGKTPDEKVIGLHPESVSDIITRAARKAGVDIHAHSLRDYFATRLVDRVVDLETIRRLLGHESLDITQRYLARTDAQRKDAIKRLEEPVSPELDSKASLAEPKVPEADALRTQRTRTHHQKMIKLISRWREQLWPQLWMNPIRDLGETGLHRGKGDPPLLWEVTNEGQVTLCLPLEVSADPEIVIIRDYLWQHLQSSELSWLLNQPETGLTQWKTIGGREFVKRAELIVAIDHSCQKITGSHPSDKANQTGPILEFSNTIWALVTDGFYRELSYSVERDPVTMVYIAKYGAFIIASTDTAKEAKRYVTWHKKLMSKWKTDRLSQEIVELIQSRERIAHKMNRSLAKLSVDGHIPGRCEGCP